MRLKRHFVAGLVFGLALLASPLLGASLSLLTGPAGTNPAAFPADLPDINTVINGINQNAAFAGTGTPSAVIGAAYTSSNKLGTGSATTTILQIINGAVWTTTTGTATCNMTGNTLCLGILDQNGILRWIGLSGGS